MFAPIVRSLRSACLWAGAPLLAGCTALVEPPPAVHDPVPVVLLDRGRHSSLLLPGPDATAIEFAYGEWEWFALANDGWWRVPAVLFWPTRGALGRREWPSAAAAEAGTEHAYVLVVERAAAQSLRTRLEARFAAGSAEQVHSALYGLDFVPDEDSFWIGHTCNAAAAEWLAELGCRVSGSTLMAEYRMPPARGP
jgi:hypothetical protein